MTRFAVVVAMACSLAVACADREEATPPPNVEGAQTATETTGEESAPLRVGSEMPAFNATRVGGGQFSWSEMRGRPVLLNLWATWCGPCRAEIPELQRLHEEHEGEGFAVLGVSVDDPSAAAEIPKFLQEYGVTYPNVLDPEAKVAEMFNAYALPTSALIDRNGRIVWIKIGIIRFEDPELQRALATALGSAVGDTSSSQGLEPGVGST